MKADAGRFHRKGAQPVLCFSRGENRFGHHFPLCPDMKPTLPLPHPNERFQTVPHFCARPDDDVSGTVHLMLRHNPEEARNRQPGYTGAVPPLEHTHANHLVGSVRRSRHDGLTGLLLIAFSVGFLTAIAFALLVLL